MTVLYKKINNYLGNVNVVITDRRTLSSPAPGASTWEAVVVSTSDYYPFGMQMPGRTNSYGAGVDYRYAYNGMETDGEVSGSGNSYTTEFRQYDPRLGRWKSLDPLMKMFPSMSPYCAFDNNPVFYVDPLGLEGSPKTHELVQGETLESLSKQYGVSVEQLQKWNPCTVGREKKLQIGEKIIVGEPQDIGLGSKGEVGTGEDSESHGGSNGPAVTPKTERGQELVERDKNDGVVENLMDYIECNDLAIDNELNFDWHKIRNQFGSGKGGLVTNLNLLEQKMANSNVGKELEKNIVTYFQEQMKKSKGDYSKIDFSNSNIDPPDYGDIDISMKALVGGTQKLRVVLNKIDVDVVKRTYEATISYVLYDDYGVSEGDFLKADSFNGTWSGCREGLVAMWILQHTLGYKPVTTKFVFTTKVTGGY